MITRFRLALPLALALVVGFPAVAQAGEVKRCGRIGFTPQTDDVASNIRARGTTCRRARRIVRQVHEHDNRSPFGYRCRRRLIDAPLPFSKWTCTKGARRVTWQKT